MLARFHRRLKADAAIHLAGVELCVVVAMTAGLSFAAAPPSPTARLAKVMDGEVSDAAFARLTGAMDMAMLSLASRHLPRERLFPAGALDAAPGMTDASLDPAAETDASVIRLQDLPPDAARIWNANAPDSATPNPAAQPFRLNAGGVLDEARAADCLTAAVYYEAAVESLDGQRAVAQVVLNRARHPAYPKTVCGVVFQGSNRKTGCQFSFTCDGSLGRTPSSGGWSRARQVAIAALNGYVMRTVGNATHYHANYVAPYWSPSLLKIGAIGAHIFYRWTGSQGQPPAFSGRYPGGEMDGLRMATLDALVKEPASFDAAPDAVAPSIDSAAMEVAATAPRRARAADPGSAMLDDAEVLSPAGARPEAGEIVQAEALDWAGRPKPKASPRVAMPSHGAF